MQGYEWKLFLRAPLQDEKRDVIPPPAIHHIMPDTQSIIHHIKTMPQSLPYITPCLTPTVYYISHQDHASKSAIHHIMPHAHSLLVITLRHVSKSAIHQMSHIISFLTICPKSYHASQSVTHNTMSHSQSHIISCLTVCHASCLSYITSCLNLSHMSQSVTYRACHTSYQSHSLTHIMSVTHHTSLTV